MKVIIFFSTYGPIFIASLSGALLFAITQSRFHGVSKILAFFISFFMGIIGADNTSLIISRYFPENPDVNRETGAFICSAVVVTLITCLTSRINSHQQGHNDQEEK